MQPQSFFKAALSLVTSLAIPATVFAAGGIVVPPGPTGNYNNKNQPMQMPLQQTLKFQKSTEATIAGKKRLAAMFGPVTGSGSIIALVGLDPKTNENIQAIEATVTHLKEGDVVNVDLQKMGGQWNITKAKIIEVKEGEETPHGYVFKESYPEPSTNAALIRVTKYDMSYEMMIPFVKDEKGQPQPDATLVAAVQALKADQLVYVQSAPAGKKTLLVNIFPFKESQTGKIVKVSDQAVDAGKTQAVDIETSDGKSVTALVPGKVVSKKFVPDPVLKSSVHGLKPGAEVSFLTHDDNGKSFLVEITKLPPAPKTPAASKEKPDKMEKMEKPAADAK